MQIHFDVGIQMSTPADRLVFLSVNTKLKEYISYRKMFISVRKCALYLSSKTVNNDANLENSKNWM